MSLFILAPMSTLAMSDTADFSGSFGGASYNVETSTHVFPSGAEGWAGFSNQNTDLYPLRFADEGMITFNGSVPSGGEVAVRFKLERLPHPNTEPSYSSLTVTISGAEEASYNVVIPSQGDNTFSSLILYVVTQDEAVIITDVIVDGETVIVEEPAGPEIFAVGDVIDFETDVAIASFGGTNGTLDVDGNGNMFLSVLKSNGAQTWAGNTIGKGDYVFPLTDTDSLMSANVYSTVAVPVRMKLENSANADQNASVTVDHSGSGWEILDFDFAGTNAIDANFDTLALFPNYGNAGAGNTYQFDDIKFEGGNAVVDPCSFGDNIINIEAESYTAFTGAIDSQETEDNCGSMNMGWIDADDSMTYTVTIPSAGNYAVSYRVASEFGSSPGFELYVDDALVDAQGVNATGGWQKWVTIDGRVISLDAGDHSIKWKAASNGININWFRLTPTDAVADDAPVLLDPEPAVSFTVTASGSVVKMHSSAFGWNLNNALIATDNGDGTWTATINPGPLIDLKYKWIVDDVQEDLSAAYRAGNCSNDNISAVDDQWFNRVWVYGSGNITGDVPSTCT
ncbi:MAG: carbohydrate-binding protein, partial [Porticoccaceae bacterium]